MFSREKRLVRHYERLKAAGHRSTPGIRLHGEERSVTIVAAPGAGAPYWVIFDGAAERRIETKDIAELDSVRWLAGYGY